MHYSRTRRGASSEFQASDEQHSEHTWDHTLATFANFAPNLLSNEAYHQHVDTWKKNTHGTTTTGSYDEFGEKPQPTTLNWTRQDDWSDTQSYAFNKYTDGKQGWQTGISHVETHHPDDGPAHGLQYDETIGWHTDINAPGDGKGDIWTYVVDPNTSQWAYEPAGHFEHWLGSAGTPHDPLNDPPPLPAQAPIKQTKPKSKGGGWHAITEQLYNVFVRPATRKSYDDFYHDTLESYIDEARDIPRDAALTAKGYYWDGPKNLAIGAGNLAWNSTVHPIDTVMGLGHALLHLPTTFNAVKDAVVDKWNSGPEGQGELAFNAVLILVGGIESAGAEEAEIGALGGGVETGAEAEVALAEVEAETAATLDEAATSAGEFATPEEVPFEEANGGLKSLANRSLPDADSYAIGRGEDIANAAKLRPGESPIDVNMQFDPERGFQWNWDYQNRPLLEEAMKQGKPIRDISPGNSGGMYLNAERLFLEGQGWFRETIGEDQFWVPPGNVFRP